MGKRKEEKWREGERGDYRERDDMFLTLLRFRSHVLTVRLAAGLAEYPQCGKQYSSDLGPGRGAYPGSGVYPGSDVSTDCAGVTYTTGSCADMLTE